MKLIRSAIPNTPLGVFCFLIIGFYFGAIVAKLGGEQWVDPAKAAAESPDFSLQGEYVSETEGFQVIALGSEAFLVTRYEGGLPGATLTSGRLAWDAELQHPVSIAGQDKKTREEVLALVKNWKSVSRESLTLGKKAPEGSVVLFDGAEHNAFKNAEITSDGFLMSGAETKESFRDFHLHLEFRTPFKPDTPVSSQDRGNSGVYIFNRYEMQVLDSFGLDFDETHWTEAPKSKPSQWCGCLYKFKLAEANLCLPPLAWQTYDIDFTAPRFEGEKKVSNAKITSYLNGVRVQNAVELPNGTGAGGSKQEVAEGPILLQGHGNPVAYRNIWLTKKDA